MRQSSGGGTESFDSFFDGSKQSLVAMAFVLTGDLQTAQDLVQEALLRTWRRWPQVGTYDDPLGWTRRVLYNLVVSDSRRRKFRRRPIDPPPPLRPPDDSHLELAAALRRCLINR